MGSRPSQFTLTGPVKLRLYSTRELLNMPPPTWLVDGIIPNGAMVAEYGQPETKKSFVAIDIALSVATGLPWLGHETERGYVVYISAEGGAGIGKRARVWLAYYGLDPDDADIAWLVES